MKALIVIFALLSTFSQLFWIIKGKVKPPRVSWIIWFLIGIMCFAVNLGFKGWDETSILLAAYSFGNIFIVGYILLKNPGGWTKKEARLLAATLIIMLIWLPFKFFAVEQAFIWATVLSQLLLHAAHFIGVWNQWQKVWKDHFTETIDSWIYRWLSVLLTTITILSNSEIFSTMSDLFISLIPPVYGLCTVTTLLFLIKIRRKKLRR